MDRANLDTHTAQGQGFAPITKPEPRVVYDTDMLLLDGLMGYGPELLAEAKTLAGLIDEYERLGRIHAQGEAEGWSKRQLTKAEDAWHEAGDRVTEASLALLRAETSGADATARLTVYIREREMFATPVAQWRPRSAHDAIQRLTERMPGCDEDLAPALQFALKHLPSAVYDLKTAAAADRWKAARDRYLAAKAAHDAQTEDPGDEDPLFNELCNALEGWEQIPPPSVEAMAEVMRASLEFMLPHSWSTPDCPRTMRDLLDGGDRGEEFAARYYLHALRLAGSQSQALITPPVGGLFPAFRAADHTHPDAQPGEMHKAWKEHHRDAEPHEGRAEEFSEWRFEARDFQWIEGGGPIGMLWKYQAALYARARALVDEYEALGGSFQVIRDTDGGYAFGTTFVIDDATGRANEIVGLLNSHEPLRKTVASVIQQRDGVIGDATAIAAE
ncbi:MAG: hypothetical protein JNK30_21120 [Phenylobacterium sp.]|uniref:hypothetical protein n=1 Tax=Phenylobacterium sp. TaxID=1871053 RepID=UPI001A4D44B5|nr:hypothetical protein [Phenylobacterium sp.]MBL8773902.1 hypothetical protein [Phenylobacterium sp.]